MLSWFLQQANVENAILERRGDMAFAWQEPRFLYFGLPIVAVLGVGIFLLQRRHLRSASLSLILSLTACRVFVLSLLVVVLAGPFVSLVVRNEKRPIVVVMFDSSRSMSLPSGEPNITRAKLAQTAAQAQKDILFAPLFAKYEVRFYAFAKNAEQFGVDPKNFALSEPSIEGPVTHLGDSVARVVELAEGRPIAGVIVFSDGENTGGKTLEEAAEECRKRRAPVIAIPVGPMRVQNDVSIVDVSSSGHVAVGDNAKVTVLIESHGYDGKQAKVELFDGTKLLKAEDVILRGAEQQTIELTFTATEAGVRVLSVKIKPFEDESIQENNRDQTLLHADEEKIKVLYIEGPPRWDFRFLKNAMRRDSGLAGRKGTQVDIVLENEWRRLSEADQANALPKNLDELAAYHTIILGDVSPKLLTLEFIQLLDRAVREKGVGLLIEAGPLAMPHVYGDKLLGLLPVVLATDEKRVDDARMNGLFATTARPFKLELTEDGKFVDAMRLYDDAGRNQSAWAQMPPYQWCVNAVRPTASATVLMSNTNVQTSFGKLPLIAHHQVEKGRVMLVGTDSTWLWRQNAADRFFYKFWGQTIRFVARQDDAKKRPPGQNEPATIVANRLSEELRYPKVNRSKLRLLAQKSDPRSDEERGNEVALYELTDPEWAAKVLKRIEQSNLQVVEEHTPKSATLWDNWITLALLVGVYCVDIGLRRWTGLS